jgi:hypothetical protein
MESAYAARVSISSVFDGLARTPFEVCLVGGLSPDVIEHAVVLAAVKDAARR